MHTHRCSQDEVLSMQVLFQKQDISTGAPLNILLMGGGSEGFFGGLKFWPKGIFWVYEGKLLGFFLGHEKNTGIFFGIVTFISSNQQKRI